MLTLVERKTQLAKITKLPRATARATQKAAVRRLKPIGDFVHTITFDNGKEFAAHQDIAQALKTKIFFATPYHAWERGLNENTNGPGCVERRSVSAPLLVRRRFRDHGAERRSAQNWLPDRARRSLGRLLALV